MNMFKTTDAETPKQYIEAIVDSKRQADIKQLDELIRKTAPKLKPHIRSGMIGYGSYHYKYDSGREGEWFVIGLASNKRYISLYLSCTTENGYLAEQYKDRLPNANIGKSCIRFSSLKRVDLDVLEEALKKAADFQGD